MRTTLLEAGFLPGKIFTTGLVGWPGVIPVPNGDFAKVVDKADFDEALEDSRATVTAEMEAEYAKMKGELKKRLQRDKLDGRIVAVQTVDRMTDREIAARIREYFRKRR